jgi:hypothetical protein
VLGILLGSCVKDPPTFYSGVGKKPIYLSYAALNQIKNIPPQAVVESGTIFLQDTLLFILERGKGVHVFSVVDPTNTIKLTFLQIPAITDFTITGHRLYADSWKDLVTIDISDIYNIFLVDRTLNAFEPPLFPPQYQGIFECVDPLQGAVVGWDSVELKNVQCRTVN